ncbi:MAG: hypothetical protein KGL39_03775 [Patescibacteria group bacterium]|nr:hypothetical protein [Patescibacteria group bacterium]
MTEEEIDKMLDQARPYGEEAWKRVYESLRATLNGMPSGPAQIAAVSFVTCNMIDLLLSISAEGVAAGDRPFAAASLAQMVADLCARFVAGDTPPQPFYVKSQEDGAGHA